MSPRHSYVGGPGVRGRQSGVGDPPSPVSGLPAVSLRLATVTDSRSRSDAESKEVSLILESRTRTTVDTPYDVYRPHTSVDSPPEVLLVLDHFLVPGNPPRVAGGGEHRDIERRQTGTGPGRTRRCIRTSTFGCRESGPLSRRLCVGRRRGAVPWSKTPV